VIDSELDFNELSPDFLRLLRQFAPFGYGNNKPCFLTQNIVTSGRASIVGKNHLRMRARQDNVVFEAIGFNLGDKLELCNAGEPLSMVYTIEEILHHQRVSLQLYIKDIALTKDQPLRTKLVMDEMATTLARAMAPAAQTEEIANGHSRVTNGGGGNGASKHNGSNGAPSLVVVSI
jgi:hypothetical protein